MNTQPTKEEALARLSEIKSEETRLKKIIEQSDKKPSIRERVLTVKDVLSEYGTTVEEFDEKYKDYAIDTKAYELLKLIIKLFNKGWLPDVNNPNQRYYEAIFIKGAAFRFCYAFCGWTNTHTVGGSRLWFKDESTAKHVCTNPEFVKVWKEFIQG